MANEHLISTANRLCQVLDAYHFGHVRLINVAVTSDCSRLIAIGPSVPPANGPQPTRQTKVEKRIIGKRVFGFLCFLSDRGEQYTICIRKERRGTFDAIAGVVAMLIMLCLVVKHHCMMMSATLSYQSGCLSSLFRSNRYVSYISVPVLHLTGMSRPPPSYGSWRSCGTERERTGQVP